jgi:hypothetical protein
MKKSLSVKNIAIAVLVALVMVKWFGPKEKVYIDKPYEVVKQTTDTVTVVDQKVVFKKGKTVYEKVTVEKEIVLPAVVDTASILKQYYSRVGYQDTLRLQEGSVSVLDSITENRIFARSFIASIKPKVEIKKDTVMIKEPAKTKIYYGPEAGFNTTNVVSHLGIAVLVKSKKDRMYNIGIGYSSQVVGSKLQSWTPYISTGIFWRVK